MAGEELHQARVWLLWRPLLNDTLQPVPDQRSLLHGFASRQLCEPTGTGSAKPSADRPNCGANWSAKRSGNWSATWSAHLDLKGGPQCGVDWSANSGATSCVLRGNRCSVFPTRSTRTGRRGSERHRARLWHPWLRINRDLQPSRDEEMLLGVRYFGSFAQDSCMKNGQDCPCYSYKSRNSTQARR